MRRFLILPLMLALTACAGSGDKYPYPAQFVTPAEMPAPQLQGPPSAKLQKKEIAGIIATQKKLSDTEKKIIMAEDHIQPAMIVTPILGEQYNEKSNPALFTLLKHAASDAWRLADAEQEYWKRDRPWVTDKRVQLLVGKITRPSHPSGHTVTNHVWAYILSDLFPAKREALFARAYQIGMHRVEAGVHYPSDVEAGKHYAALLWAKMETSDEFQRELAAVKAELAVPKAANDNIPASCGNVRTKWCQ